MGECAKCGRKAPKKALSHLYLKADGYCPLKILCHLCLDCLATMLDDLGVGM